MTIFFLILTRYRLLLDDWRGYLLAFFALVAVANVYMSSFARLRQEVKSKSWRRRRRKRCWRRSRAMTSPRSRPGRASPPSARRTGELLDDGQLFAVVQHLDLREELQGADGVVLADFDAV